MNKKIAIRSFMCGVDSIDYIVYILYQSNS